jgi:hypothetical protein
MAAIAARHTKNRCHKMGCLERTCSCQASRHHACGRDPRELSCPDAYDYSTPTRRGWLAMPDDEQRRVATTFSAWTEELRGRAFIRATARNHA